MLFTCKIGLFSWFWFIYSSVVPKLIWYLPLLKAPAISLLLQRMMVSAVSFCLSAQLDLSFQSATFSRQHQHTCQCNAAKLTIVSPKGIQLERKKTYNGYLSPTYSDPVLKNQSPRMYVGSTWRLSLSATARLIMFGKKNRQQQTKKHWIDVFLRVGLAFELLSTRCTCQEFLIYDSAVHLADRPRVNINPAGPQRRGGDSPPPSMTSRGAAAASSFRELGSHLRLFGGFSSPPQGWGGTESHSFPVEAISSGQRWYVSRGRGRGLGD